MDLYKFKWIIYLGIGIDIYKYSNIFVFTFEEGFEVLLFLKYIIILLKILFKYFSKCGRP